MHDDGQVTVKYGRVGSTSNEETRFMTQTELDRKIAEKLKARGKLGTPTYKPPYREIQVVAEASAMKGVTGPTGATKVELHAAATSQLLGKDAAHPELTKLVTRLVEANKHELHQASGGQLNVDLSTGLITTPVGVVTKADIDEARVILDQLAPYVLKSDFDAKAFMEGLNQYLMRVPQKVGHSRGWHHHFVTDQAGLSRQSSLLDQLEASASLAADRIKAAKDGAVKSSLATTPSLFNAELSILDDAAQVAEIKAFFESTVMGRHDSAKLKPIRFYKVRIDSAESAFATDGAKLKNHWRLWHGTRIFNVLSILKTSLLLPKTLSTMQLAGAMFGNGCYFSDQSTKSLNYSYGYWGGGPRDSNCFMFLFDVAMGEPHIPKSSYESLPRKGSDSTFAVGSSPEALRTPIAKAHGKGSTGSGVLNNEMIVYRTSQAVPRFLVEFSEK